MNWSWQAAGEFLPILLRGAQLTAFLTIISLALSLVLGLFVAFGRISRNRLLSTPAAMYVNLIRGTPLLVTLVFIYFALPDVGVKLTPLQAGIIGLTLNETAYLAEIYRAGIQSVAKGQLDAAYSLGMSYQRAMQRIILPQALRNVLPPISNSAVILLKSSSLASVISVGELMREAEVLAASTFRSMQVYTMIAVIYWLMHYPLARLTRWLESRGSGASPP